MKAGAIRLFHGTSTLFLTDILASGLGGRNPILEWNVPAFAKVIYPTIYEHLSQDEEWMLKVQSFGFMVEQKSAAMNFQHGNTYLTPIMATAVRYAISNQYGSELLTYCLQFLNELIKRRLTTFTDDLRQEFPRFFEFLEIPCAPLLIEINEIPVEFLVDEFGGEPSNNIDRVLRIQRDDPRMADLLLQQTNFRLRQAVPLEKLIFKFIHVRKVLRPNSDYSLHVLSVPGAYPLTGDLLANRE